jgi:multiple sugar transport system permease protein
MSSEDFSSGDISLRWRCDTGSLAQHDAANSMEKKMKQPGKLRQIDKTKRQRYLFAYGALIPIIAMYAILRIVPIAQNVLYSFFNSSIGNPMAEFVGFSNYKELFSDNLFAISIKNTTIFAVFVTFFGVVIALLVALMLATPSKMSLLYETAFFLPVITPMVPVAVVWKWIYDPTYGLLNYILSWFGFEPIGWLIYPQTALLAIIIMSVWKIIGYNMIIFLVGIRDIPETYIEAAMIDGASRGQIFGKIILPLLRPIILLVTVITTINSYNVFTQVYIMTSGAQGAPGGAVRTLVFDIYENAFRYFKTGYAAAEAVMLLLIILALTFLQFGLGGKEPKKRRHTAS